MNNLKSENLSELSVQEMNGEETRNVNGGYHPVLWLLAGVIISELLDRNAAKDFNDGRDAARKFWN